MTVVITLIIAMCSPFFNRRRRLDVKISLHSNRNRKSELRMMNGDIEKETKSLRTKTCLDSRYVANHPPSNEGYNK